MLMTRSAIQSHDAVTPARAFMSTLLNDAASINNQPRRLNQPAHACVPLKLLRLLLLLMLLDPVLQLLPCPLLNTIRARSGSVQTAESLLGKLSSSARILISAP